MMVAMDATLRGLRAGVLDYWERVSARDAAPAGQQAREVLARRAARHRAEVAVEVRLVVVAAGGGDVGEPPGPALALEEVEHPLEAQDAREGLGRQADLLAEAGGEMAPAAAQLGAQLA